MGIVAGLLVADAVAVVVVGSAVVVGRRAALSIHVCCCSDHFQNVAPRRTSKWAKAKVGRAVRWLRWGLLWPWRPRLSRRFARQAFDEANDAASQLWALDLRVRPDERQTIGSGSELAEMRRDRRSRGVLCRIAPVRKAFEKEWNWHLEEVRYLLKLAGADPIGAFLVFLHLLERDAERVGKFGLAEAKHEAAHAHAAADVLIGWVGWFSHGAASSPERQSILANRAYW